MSASFLGAFPPQQESALLFSQNLTPTGSVRGLMCLSILRALSRFCCFMDISFSFSAQCNKDKACRMASW